MLGLTVIRTLQKKGVMAVAKHFPGLGAAPLDPHHKLPVMDLTEKELEKMDLPPFKEAITGGVSSIMTSHALYPCIDPGTYIAAGIGPVGQYAAFCSVMG